MVIIPYFGDEVNVSPQALCRDGLIGSFPSEDRDQMFCQYGLPGIMKPWNFEDEIHVGITEDQNLASHEFPPD